MNVAYTCTELHSFMSHYIIIHIMNSHIIITSCVDKFISDVLLPSKWLHFLTGVFTKRKLTVK